jgi:hypothetical protein
MPEMGNDGLIDGSNNAMERERMFAGVGPGPRGLFPVFGMDHRKATKAGTQDFHSEMRF